MSLDQEALLISQRDVHGRISCSMENLKKMGAANITTSAIETRVHLLDQLWAKFETQHELVRASYKKAYEKSEYCSSGFPDTAEGTYVQQRSALVECGRALRATQETTTPAVASTVEPTAEQNANTLLPRIKLKPFSGKFEDWPSFRDLYLSIIGENPKASKVQRLQYLRSCLSGPAERLVQTLPVTSDNYDRAWKILCDHYDNKREMMRSNFATFTAVTKMKADTADELSRIHQAVVTIVNSQESIGRPIKSNGMDLLNHLIVELFDSQTRLEWESSTSDSVDPPAHETLTHFITRRILTLNAVKPRANSKPAKETRTARSHFAKPEAEAQCALCKGNHSLMRCEDFKAKSTSDRKSFVEANRLCFNCLGRHQVSKCASTRTCLTCISRHHSMLHEEKTPPRAAEANALTAVQCSCDSKATLLATARVFVADRHGDPHAVRVLIDQGSEVSIISEALTQRLRLPRLPSSMSILGVGGTSSGSTRGRVTLTITAKVSNAELHVSAFVLPRLSLYRGTSAPGDTKWPHVQGLALADPQYLDNDPIELLLGAEVCSTILQEGLRRGGPQSPIAQKTVLGWILSGGCSAESLHGRPCSLHCTADHDLIQLVQTFWEQEREPSSPPILSPDEEMCETLFTRTVSRTTSGRYVVRLPFAEPPPVLHETRLPAERLLAAMERKFTRDGKFRELYTAFMQEYLELQHMSEVHPSDRGQARCYLPHHGVLRDSQPDKLRVVFNGSQRTGSGESLNTKLLVGANLLPSLADVLLRWRWHRFAFVTDIEKMYRQILIHPDDRDHQRVLWRADRKGDVQDFRLNTVTYGLACAPFLAIRTLHQLAEDEGARYPRGAAALRHDCYVDDIVTGAHSIHDAIALQTELRELCTAGGFPLRKWAASHSEILRGVPPNHRLQTPSHSWNNQGHATLGLRWHPKDDHFSVVIRPLTEVALTKRRVLAETARLFDPLGWLAPVIIRAKILIQSAWLQRIDWDTPLPAEDVLRWKGLLDELPLLDQIRVNRWLGCDSEDSQLEMHGFADASERGYAAVVYLRSTISNGTSLHLLAAKSRVAPVKQVSVPRLELCAAALLANLAQHLRSVLDLGVTPVYLWSDSSVTLHWIQGHASRWKTYVANRVSQIQTVLPEARWLHVPGRDNPADCASRGMSPSELVDHALWWSGPTWLGQDKDSWPTTTITSVSEEEMPEQRSTSLSAAVQAAVELEILLRFSALHRLLRVTAWCRRWRLARTRPSAPENTLQSDELDEALRQWLIVVQSIHYPAEIAAVKDGRTVSTRSPLARLNPIMGEEGLLRVGGRLKHALLTHDERHPMVAPPASWLTRLLVDACHRRTLHGGVQLTLDMLRSRFWVPQGRAVVKKVIHRCVTCVRWRAASPQPSMGNLPRGRVIPARPFLRTGVDYAGLIFVRTTKGRGHRSHKAFIAVFICLFSRAVHLEVASDYSADAFLAAFRRFISRRGLCEEMYSDCGTNFTGADKELRRLFQASSSDGRRIAHAAATTGIKWSFNPPAAPHFGGLWEAAVIHEASSSAGHRRRHSHI